MSQKDSVYYATLSVAKQLGIDFESPNVHMQEHKDKVVALVLQDFESNKLTTKAGKTGEDLRKYVSSLVSNCWLKDDRLNPVGTRIRLKPIKTNE